MPLETQTVSPGRTRRSSKVERKSQGESFCPRAPGVPLVVTCHSEAVATVNLIETMVRQSEPLNIILKFWTIPPSSSESKCACVLGYKPHAGRRQTKRVLPGRRLLR